MATLETSTFGTALSVAGAPASELTSLYGSGPRTGDNTGLRNFYRWGLWTYCAASTSSGTADYCTSTTFGARFEPATAIIRDIPTGLSSAVNQVLPDGTFLAGNYTGTFTRIAFYLLFVGAILAGAAMLVSLSANRFGYVLAATISFLGFACVGAGATIWTIIIHKVRSSVNGATVTGGTSLGLRVTWGNVLWITWGAAAALLLATLPLLIACCTGRNKHQDDYYGGAQSTYGGRNSQYAGSTYRGGSTRGGGSKRGSQYEPSIRY